MDGRCQQGGDDFGMVGYIASSHRHLHESEDLLPQVTHSIGRNYKRALKLAVSAKFTAGELLAVEDLLFQGDDGGWEMTERGGGGKSTVSQSLP
ncbi:hypothetical protein [Vibrio sp. 10N.261.51.F12]|uniref:hypothetical protein n=1 Tax=Vibrio sp. 10N.261.51.F12 TaxID=3229679 RepID=UPI00354ADF05